MFGELILTGLVSLLPPNTLSPCESKDIGQSNMTFKIISFFFFFQLCKLFYFIFFNFILFLNFT